MSWKDEVLAQTKSVFENYERIKPYRESRKEFIGKVLKADDGSPFISEPLNESWISHIEFCERNNLYPGFLAPFGHGKTVTAIVGYLLKRIGENPNLRAKIISSIETEAIKRTKAIRKYIEEDLDYREIYPEILPSRTWAESSYTVQRTNKSIDPTVEAKGVLAGGIGGRMDMVFFDDAVSYKNAIKEPGNRDKVREEIENTWLSRLDPGGIVVMVATAWHEEDATHHFMRNPEFCFLIQRISEDFERIECEVKNSPDPNYQKFILPLSVRWPKQALKTRCDLLGKRAFDRGFRQRAYSDEERVYKAFPSCLDYTLSINQVRNRVAEGRDFFVSVGVDLSSKKRPGNAIFVLGIDNQNYKYFIDVITGKWTSPETADQLAYICHQYKPNTIVVENNAYQTALIEWIKESKKEYNFWDKIIPFTTGKQKADEQLGLPALEVEFENKSWKIACKEQVTHEPGCKCDLCRWQREVHDYPMYATTDCLMASWFAWHGINRVYGGTREAPEAFGKTAYEEETKIDEDISFIGGEEGMSIAASTDWDDL